METVIVDYGLGNLRSVQKSIEKIGESVKISNNIKDIETADRLILPGVGAFCDAITLLNKKELDKAICKFVKTERPLLGICLGMQLLYDKSYEGGIYEGLGLIEGEIKKFVGDYKVPHIGWNDICSTKGILSKNLENPYVYFVHSYYAPVNYATDTTTSYGGVTFSSAIAYQNIFATQFHPEKSGDVGLSILKNFFNI